MVGLVQCEDGNVKVEVEWELIEVDFSSLVVDDEFVDEDMDSDDDYDVESYLYSVGLVRN